MAGPGELPEDGWRDSGPEPPVLRRLAGDRPVQRRVRAPVPGVHDQVGHLRGEADRAAAVQGWPAAGLPGPRRRRPGPAAGRAGVARRGLRDRLPRGNREPRPGPVADGGQDRRGPAGPDHRRAGHPDRALGRAGGPPVRHQAAPPVPAQDRPDDRRAAGRPVRLRGPAPVREHAARGHGRHHGRHHRAAGQDQAEDASRRTLGSRRRWPAFFLDRTERGASLPSAAQQPTEAQPTEEQPREEQPTEAQPTQAQPAEAPAEEAPAEGPPASGPI